MPRILLSVSLAVLLCHRPAVAQDRFVGESSGHEGSSDRESTRKTSTVRGWPRIARGVEGRPRAAAFVLGEDVGVYGGAFGITKGFVERFGEARCLDTPISESCIIGVSVGASLVGFRPVVEMQFGDFIACGFDQVVNQAATLRYRYGGRESPSGRAAVQAYAFTFHS